MTLKKALVAITVVAMLFGMVGTAFAATVSGNAFPDVAGSKFADSVNFLAAYGIVKGDNGSFYPERPLTRAEFVTIVVRMLGKDAVASSLTDYTPAFNDGASIPDWAKGYVNVAQSMGLVKGDDKGNFNSTNNVTFAETLAILVRALGHDPKVTGPWPINYLVKGADLGISDGVTVSANLPATRGEMAKMTFNAMHADRLELTVDGYVTADSIVAAEAITGNVTAASSSSITIGADTKSFATTVAIVGAPNFDGLKGLDVSAFVNSSGKIYLVEVNTSDVASKALVFSKLSSDVTVDGTTYYLEMTDGTKVEYDPATTAFEINKLTAQTDADLAKYDELQITTTDGVASYVTATRFDVADSVATVDGKDRTVAKNYQYVTTADGEVKVTGASITLNGVPAKVTDLKKNDVLTYAVNATADPAVDGIVAFAVRASRNIVAGTITAVTSNTYGDSVTVKLADGTSKDIDLAGALTAADFSYGQAVKLGLNVDGAAAVDFGDSTNTFVKIISISTVSDANGSHTVVNIDNNGTAQTYTLTTDGADPAVNFPNFVVGAVGSISLIGGKADDFAAIDTAALVSGTVYSIDATNKVIVVKDEASGVLYVTSADGFATYTEKSTSLKAAGSYTAVSDLTVGQKVWYNTTTNKVDYILVDYDQAF